MCNRFRHTMKPMIKTLATTTENSILSTDLVRDDTIDVVGKHVNKEVHLEAEDTITDGTLKVRFHVQKVSEYNDVDYEENIVTINIENGTTNYQGTNDFPSCTMNDKVFIISNPNKLRVDGIHIKENRTKRRMEFTTNDLAYTCEINALHNKIDSLLEQIEKNDTALATTLNEFPTVDEVNEALEKVKNAIPAPVDLTNYATKSDLNIYIQAQQDLAIIVGEHVASIVTINSQISNLERENATLKTKLEEIENNWWKNFYPEFDTEILYEDSQRFEFIYCNDKIFSIEFDDNPGYSELLGIFKDKSNITHFVRIHVPDADEKEGSYVDEIYGSVRSYVDDTNWAGGFTMNLNIDYGTGRFDNIYGKK